MDKVLLYKLTLKEMDDFTIEQKKKQEEKEVVNERLPFFKRILRGFMPPQDENNDMRKQLNQILDNSLTVIYTLTYNIDEDRFWFKKTDGFNNIIESHHTKKDFDGSFEILDAITERYFDILEDVSVDISIDYDIRTDNSKEDILRKIKKHTKKLVSRQEGYFLKS